MAIVIYNPLRAMGFTAATAAATMTPPPAAEPLTIQPALASPAAANVTIHPCATEPPINGASAAQQPAPPTTQPDASPAGDALCPSSPSGTRSSFKQRVLSASERLRKAAAATAVVVASAMPRPLLSPKRSRASSAGGANSNPETTSPSTTPSTPSTPSSLGDDNSYMGSHVEADLLPAPAGGPAAHIAPGGNVSAGITKSQAGGQQAKGFVGRLLRSRHPNSGGDSAPVILGAHADVTVVLVAGAAPKVVDEAAPASKVASRSGAVQRLGSRQWGKLLAAPFVTCFQGGLQAEAGVAC